MRKMKLVAMASVLCLLLGSTVQAAKSQTSYIQVVQEVDLEIDGEKVIPVVSEGSKNVSVEEGMKYLNVDTEYYDRYTMDVSLETLAGEAKQLNSGSVTLTFRVPKVSPDCKVVVLHWAEGSSAPEQLPCKAGDGVVSATFTSFSPVVILVSYPGSTGGSNAGGSSAAPAAPAAAAPAAASGTVSPKTGEGFELYMAAAVAVLALAGGVVFERKSRA